MSLAQRVQSWAPVPVYPAIGEGGSDALAWVRLDPALRVVASVRHASILLVCGGIREGDRAALRRLHDQLAHPRATLWWDSAPFEEAVDAVRETGGDPASALRRLDRRLRAGERTSEADWLPDEPPNPWEGKGDHGQGGKGMMGGVPYGRPMAMTDEDLRDGLMLDAMTIHVGPFAAMLPAGLSLALTLQGDVVQCAKVLTPAYTDDDRPEAASLRLAAGMLDLIGLGVLTGLCRAAARTPGFSRDALHRAVRRSGAFIAIPPGLGEVGGTDARTRLRGALMGENPLLPADAPMLVTLLPGLEWQEAMLVINSFSPAQLARIAPVTPDEEDHADEKRHGHGHRMDHH